MEGEKESGSEEESERSVELSVDTSGGKGPWCKVNVLTDDAYEEHLRAVAAYATAAASTLRQAPLTTHRTQAAEGDRGCRLASDAHAHQQ